MFPRLSGSTSGDVSSGPTTWPSAPTPSATSRGSRRPPIWARRAPGRGGGGPALRGGRGGREVRALQPVPSQADQQARAEFGLGRWLAERGRGEAAERHFVRAGELAPHDFTIRRGTMPIRGIDPMGPAFRAMLEEWVGAGKSYYRPLPD